MNDGVDKYVDGEVVINVERNGYGYRNGDLFRDFFWKSVVKDVDYNCCSKYDIIYF